MYRIPTIIVFCLLLLLEHAGSFKLTPTKILSRLRKQPLELKGSASIPRDLHTCSAGCSFTLSFNDSLVLPDNCPSIETDHACEMNIIIDYTSQDMLIYSYQNADGLTIANTTYDSAETHFAYFEFNNNSTYHFFDYTCAIGSFCEWEYVQQTIPKLITLNYQSLYHALLPRISNLNGHPDITQCYNDTRLINCSSGSCEFFQSVDDDYNLTISRDCSIFEGTSIEIAKVRYFPGPAKHDYDVLTFTCNKDKCNDQSNEYEIRQIISSEGNEYIHSNSLGRKLNFSLYLFSFVFIRSLQ
jgi:hypothetical protein